jgi:hypothetical protein
MISEHPISSAPISSLGDSTISLVATKIGTSESIGSHTLTIDLTTTKIPTAENIEDHTLEGQLTLAASLVASAESIGVHNLELGVANLTSSIILTSESIGSHTLSVGTVNLTSTIVPSAESIGSHNIGQSLEATIIPSAESIGSHTVTTGTVNLTSTTIPTAESIGAHYITAIQHLTQTLKIGSSEIIRNHQIGETCETDYDAGLTSTTLRLTYGSNILSLRQPEFGNSHTLDTNTLIDRLRKGSLRIYKDSSWPNVEVMTFELTQLTDTEMSNLFSFLDVSKGQEIELRDWEGRTWDGVISDSDITDVTVRSRSCSRSVALRFMGSLQ